MQKAKSGREIDVGNQDDLTPGLKTILLTGLLQLILMHVTIHSAGQVENTRDTVTVSETVVNQGDQIEKTAEALELDQDYSELAEDIATFAGKPVNLNAAKEDDLDAIPFLTPAQRGNLYAYLTTYGEVFSIFELQSVKGFDSLLIRRISPYITISHPSQVPSPTPGNLFRFGHYDLLLRYEQSFPKSMAYQNEDSSRAINPDSYYRGSPQRYYFRYNYSWFDKLTIGIAGEKDPGEQFFRGAQPAGMDFYASYLCLRNIGILKNCTLGNFRVSYGQGLTLGSGLSLGAVPGFATNFPNATGIRPNLGMSEGSYLRGSAVTIKIKRLEISGFISFHPRDATVSHIDSISSSVDEISSFSGTGYHRNGQELEKRNVMTELVSGGNINLSMAPTQEIGFKIGLTGLYYKYSAEVNPVIHPYNQYVFHGKKNLNTGIDFQLRFRGQFFFGEISRSLNGGLGCLAGTVLNPDPRMCMTLIYRNYQPGYQNLFSNAFGQNSMNANERGIYVAVNAAVNPGITISGYIDLFTFPWLKYRVDAPTRGQEFGMILLLRPAREATFSLRFCQKNTRFNEKTEPGAIIHELCDNRSRSYRLGIDWLPGNGIIMKTRVDVKESGESNSSTPFGYLVYQEVQIKSFKRLENITLRFALFDIPDYTSRIYVYEPEVLFGYSVPAYQGKGMRCCTVIKLMVTRHIDLWFRGGITCYSDRSTVGSGPDLTEGSVRGELTAQLLIRL